MKIKDYKFIELRNLSGIYKITNLENNKFYIGSAKDLYDRLASHKKDLRANKHCNIYLQRSYNKYGADSFFI